MTQPTLLQTILDRFVRVLGVLCAIALYLACDYLLCDYTDFIANIGY